MLWVYLCVYLDFLCVSVGISVWVEIRSQSHTGCCAMPHRALSAARAPSPPARPPAVLQTTTTDTGKQNNTGPLGDPECGNFVTCLCCLCFAVFSRTCVANPKNGKSYVFGFRKKDVKYVLTNTDWYTISKNVKVMFLKSEKYVKYVVSKTVLEYATCLVTTTLRGTGLTALNLYNVHLPNA